jgi:hypothetical protein
MLHEAARAFHRARPAEGAHSISIEEGSLLCVSKSHNGNTRSQQVPVQVVPKYSDRIPQATKEFWRVWRSASRASPPDSRRSQLVPGARGKSKEQ